jgi:hypothetical protein
VRIPKLSLRAILAVLSVLLVVGAVSAPLVSNAAPNGDSPSAERAKVRAQKAKVASQVNALKATDAEVSQALADLKANVAGQQARYDEAQRAVSQANQALTEANAAVDAKTKEIDGLKEQIRVFAVEAFVHPPSDNALQALDSDDPGEAAQKRALLELQNTNDEDLLDRLGAAEEDLRVAQQMAEDAAARAEEKKASASKRLNELTAARDQQAAYADQVQSRLDHALSESANLAALDSKLSKQIAAQQAALARSLPRRSSSGGGSSAPRGPGGSPGGSLSPSLGSASCPGGGSITVASSIAGSLQSLLNAAAADGVSMCGGGYRSSDAQIATRQANCGSSYYDIYQKPSSQCSPPTAPPGTSMHERGLAVDFTCNGGGVISSRSSPCFVWMSAHASGYGFYNLPSEPWHWSSNGN